MIQANRHLPTTKAGIKTPALLNGEVPVLGYPVSCILPLDNVPACRLSPTFCISS